MIFRTGAQSGLLPRWDQDVKIAFRAVFGNSRHPPTTLCERIREQSAFQTDRMIDQLLSPILNSQIQGNGRRMVSYIFQLIRIQDHFSTFNLSHLSERSWKTICRLLAAALTDEFSRQSSLGSPPTTEQEPMFLEALSAIIYSTRYRNSRECVGALAALLKINPTLIDPVLLRLSQTFGDQVSSIVIPVVFRIFLDSDMVIDFDDTPWTHVLKIPRDSSTLNGLIFILTRCLISDLKESRQHTSLWFKWGLHLLLSCTQVETEFPEATVATLDRLVHSNPHSIVHTLSSASTPEQFDRLWNTTRIIGSSQQLAFIIQIWPREWSPDGSHGAPMQLLRKYAAAHRKSEIEVFRYDTPSSFHDEHWARSNLIHWYIRIGIDSGLSGFLDELQPYIDDPQTGVADGVAAQIVASTNLIEDPQWPKWIKEYLVKDIKVFQSTLEISDTLRRCLFHNASEGIALIALHGVEYLNHLPNDFFILGKPMCMEVENLFRTFGKHPEPLDPEQAEECLMRLLVNAGVDRLMWTFCTHAHFVTGDPPPRYARVSFIIRILRYYLNSKNIPIPQKNIRSPLDLSQLEKEVWDDASAAAAEVLSRDEFCDVGNNYFGGQRTWQIARIDAIMILLATSPHPFSTMLSYQVLEQELFFQWDDNPTIQPDVRRDLEERRQRRIKEGRCLGFGLHSADIDEEGAIGRTEHEEKTESDGKDGGSKRDGRPGSYSPQQAPLSLGEEEEDCDMDLDVIVNIRVFDVDEGETEVSNEAEDDAQYGALGTRMESEVMPPLVRSVTEGSGVVSWKKDLDLRIFNLANGSIA